MRRPRNKSSVVLLVALGVSALLAGCGLDSGDRIIEQLVQHNYEVDPTATLSISNEDGSIRIYGADITEVRLEAIKKAYSGQRLSKISVNVSATTNAISITTTYPPRKRWGLGDRSGTVDYTLVVPQTCKVANASLANGEMLIDGMCGEAVNARLTIGRLYGHNCFGRVRFAVTTGGIDLAYDWWEQWKFSISAEIESGNIHAFIPADAPLHLVAEADTGRIANDFAEQEDRHADDRKIDMRVGAAPEPEVNLHARDGNIEIGATNP